MTSGGPTRRMDQQCGVVSRTPNRLLVKGDFPGVGLLVLARASAVGWTAFVMESGEELPVQRLGLMHTAIPVAGGPMTIQLVYRPVGLRAGLTVTILSLLVVLLLLILDAGGAGHQPRRRRATRLRKKPMAMSSSSSTKGSGSNRTRSSSRSRLRLMVRG